MSWNFSSKYFKKVLYGLEYDCLKLSVVKLEKTLVEDKEDISIDETKEIETNSINLLIKKDIDGNVYIISDNIIVENITKIIGKINPMMVFVAKMFIPMFKPIQCKFDVDNKKILELFLNTQKIDVSDNLSSFDINSITNTGLNMPFMNTGLFSIQPNKINYKNSYNVEEEIKKSEQSTYNEIIRDGNKEEVGEDDVDDDADDDVDDVDDADDDDDVDDDADDDADINKKIESLFSEFKDMGLNNSGNEIENFNIDNLVEKMSGFDLNNLNNLLNTSTPNPNPNPNIKETKIKSCNKNNSLNTNISNLASTIGNIWTDKYYDDENLDDFLINDDVVEKPNPNDKEDSEEDGEEDGEEDSEEDNNNLTRYLKLSPEEISIELSLTNLNDYESLKESIKMLTSKEMYDEQIKMYEENENKNNMNIPGTKKWIGVDNEGEKCIYYTLGINSSETKNFRYMHFKQLESILLELVNFIQQM